VLQLGLYDDAPTRPSLRVAVAVVQAAGAIRVPRSTFDSSRLP
jgi:hypothetical protein